MRTFHKGAFSSIAANDRACWKKRRQRFLILSSFHAQSLDGVTELNTATNDEDRDLLIMQNIGTGEHMTQQIWDVSAAICPAPNPMSEKKTAVKWRSRSSFTSRYSSLSQQSVIYLELVWVDDWWLCWTLMPATNKAASGGSDDSWWQRTTDILFNLSACGGQTHCHTQ